MRTEATSLDALRHRLLEGVLMRLARLPNAGGLVLRGGLLLRHWFQPLPRPAQDLDLVAPSPLTVEEAGRRYLPLFADTGVADGVSFDTDRIHVEGIWQHTDNPGVRVHACGTLGEDEADFQVDITGGPPPWPAPVFGEFPTEYGQPARVWMCRPESVVGQKIQALWHLGMMGWRPKDLNDLHLLLARVPLDDGEVREAIAVYMADMGGTGADARALFGPSAWWGMKLSSARWLDFVKSSRGQDVPRDLRGVIAEVAERLAPVLEAAMSGGLPQAFLDAIVADIDDDAPRLIYADWLDEQGRHERAEFIRIQVELARLPAWDAAQVGLRLREQALLKLHGENWLAEMPAVKGARWEGFRRGIVAEVSFASYEAMRFNAHACRTVAPVEAVTVHWPRRKEAKLAVGPIAELRELTLTGRAMSEDEIPWLAASPQLSTLRTLSVLGLDPVELSQLLDSPHLTELRALRLVSNGLGAAGVRALTQADSLTALEELDLSGPGSYEEYYEDPIINAAGMQSLAGWAGLSRVRSLMLSGSDVRPAGLRALLRSPHVGALKELSLRGGRLDGQAMAEFASAQPGLRLETLDLGENVLKDVGAEYVAVVSCLRELKVLRLDRCEITLAGARLFATKAGFFDGLRQLDIGHNHFGPTGLAALLERKPSSLHTLRMRDNDLFEQGAVLLAGSPASDGLLEADLSQNGLGAAAAKALGAAAHLRGLLVLRLADNPINESAATALAASPLGQRLAVLELDKLPAAPGPGQVGGNDTPF